MCTGNETHAPTISIVVTLDRELDHGKEAEPNTITVVVSMTRCEGLKENELLSPHQYKIQYRACY